MISGSILNNCIIQAEAKINAANIANSMIGIAAEVSGTAVDLSISDYSQLVV
jgi:hypothetical protein